MKVTMRNCPKILEVIKNNHIISTNSISQLLNISRSTYYRIILGKKEPTHFIINKLNSLHVLGKYSDIKDKCRQYKNITEIEIGILQIINIDKIEYPIKIPIKELLIDLNSIDNIIYLVQTVDLNCEQSRGFLKIY